MIKVICCICEKELDDPGALVLGPPIKYNTYDEPSDVTKQHVCLFCWKRLCELTEKLKTQIKKGE